MNLSSDQDLVPKQEGKDQEELRTGTNFINHLIGVLIIKLDHFLDEDDHSSLKKRFSFLV